MKVTKSQKLYLSVLGIAVAAFALDKILGGAALSVPATAAAAGMNRSTVADQMPASAVAQVSDTTSNSSHNDVSERLRLLLGRTGSIVEVRDAFRPSPKWVMDRSSIGASVRAIQFQTAHHLKAVVGRGSRGEGQALVNSSLISVGQSIDGFRLTGVDQLRAMFSDGDCQVELRIPGSSLDVKSR